MRTSEKGKQLIKDFEGFRANAYKCPADVWTIGYGTTKDVQEGDVVTREEAELLLEADLVEFEQAVRSNTKVELTQEMFDALVCFTYNIGPTNFRKSTLLKLLNEGKYELAAQQFQRWNKAGGKILPGLTRRRLAEKELFQVGMQILTEGK